MDMLHVAAPCCVTRGDLICHVALPAIPPRSECMYSLLPAFLRQLLEIFWCPKWIMCGTVGKLKKSNFKRYQVCANRSLDRKIMAPGSRGVRAVFLCFSGEDSSQTGDITGEPRVTLRSQSCTLS